LSRSLDETDEFERKPRLFMQMNGIKADHILFKESVHSVQDAARALSATPADFIKSMVYIQRDYRVVAVVSGEDRVSHERLEKTLNRPVPSKIANHLEVLKHTGYPVGGVPPFGYEAVFVVDRKVMQKQIVYCGGGSSGLWSRSALMSFSEQARQSLKTSGKSDRLSNDATIHASCLVLFTQGMALLVLT
jgi:Cys-tRNA(Pro)/Cys-tRNA(Cys) deacylase